MAAPVIIDDGGSTRLKQLGPGKLDNLLEVANVGGTNQSSDIAEGEFSQIKIVCVDETGAATTITPGGAPIALVVNDTFEVFSGNHRVHGRIVDRSSNPPFTAADCEITVKAIGGIEPMVEARHHKQQRRYIISNAPAIDKVVVNAAGPPQTFPIQNAIYTVVILN